MPELTLPIPARVAITDLTRMRQGRVCVAACFRQGTSIRPIFRRGGIMEQWLWQGESVVIRPFTVVELELQTPKPDRPHTEDWIIKRSYKVIRVLTPDRRFTLLEDIRDETVAEIFGATIHEGRYVAAGKGNRSLGTVSTKGPCYISFGRRPGGDYYYQLTFTDESRRLYKLPVTDLAFRYYLDHVHIREKMTTLEASQYLTTRLNRTQTFLRIGLARGWEQHPDRCYLQITGVYSFPDYLDGRCFADFALTPEERVDHHKQLELPF